MTFQAGTRRGDGRVAISYPPRDIPPTDVSPSTETFTFTGAPQFYQVPADVTQIQVDASGAQGGTPEGTGGGLGGRTQAVISVKPHDLVNINVGGAGNRATAGWNGGGGGGCCDRNAAGGGASDVRINGLTLADRRVVAGGGGGGAAHPFGGEPGGAGGGGGGLDGAKGVNGSGQWVGGGGGTQTSGGASGPGDRTANFADPGRPGVGGVGHFGGSGGGGYYGGGGGEGDSYAGTAAGGGGGSGYVAADAKDVIHSMGAHAGDGTVTVTAITPTTPTPTPTASTTQPTDAVNEPPVFTGYPEDTVYPSVTVGKTVTFQVAAEDPEGKAVSLTYSPLPVNPLVTCEQAVPTPPATGSVQVCSVKTTKALPASPQEVIFFASDPEGQTDSVFVTIAGTKNTSMMTAHPGAIVPAIQSVNTSDRLQLDITNDSKAPFCGKPTTCDVGFYPFAGHYFKKSTSLNIVLTNKTGNRKCDSSETKASRLSTIKPVGSDVLGYRIGFDVNCGKTATQDYNGVVVDLFLTDSAHSYEYSAKRMDGLHGASVVVTNISILAQLNAKTCFAAKELEVLNALLDLKDAATLFKLVNDPEFREKLSEIVVGQLVGHALEPVPSTSSCEGSKMYYAAAAAINAEALTAIDNGKTLQFKDQLTLNGKRSQWQLWVSDPANLSPNNALWLPLINIKTTEENAMLARTRLASLARSQR